MRFGGNNFNYFPGNKLTKLANLPQFKRMVMSCPEGWGLGRLSRECPPSPLFVHATAAEYQLKIRSWFFYSGLAYNTYLLQGREINGSYGTPAEGLIVMTHWPVSGSRRLSPETGAGNRRQKVANVSST